MQAEYMRSAMSSLLLSYSDRMCFLAATFRNRTLHIAHSAGHAQASNHLTAATRSVSVLLP
eukprot:364988-Chlamydomonas_euryale.AAC.33